MTETSSDLPICIHCGTPRPADETVCPTCGKPWIDVSVKDAASGGAVVAGAASASKVSPEAAANTPPPPAALDDTGEFSFDDWTLPPERKPSKAKWLVPLALVAAVAVLWVVVFADREAGSTDQSVVAADTTTTGAPTTTRIETTTTSPATTTSTSTTTTTVVYPSAESWTAVGDPIPTTELGLKASGIGPIGIGTTITDAAGSLVASLGPANEAGVDADLCPGSEWYWLDWGDLRGIFDGYGQDSLFIAYRYETDGESEPEPTLETLSGIRLGDTVEMLQNTYASYTVSFEVIEGRDYFRLADGGDLLLWGPVTSTEPQGIIQGIYSSDPCPDVN